MNDTRLPVETAPDATSEPDTGLGSIPPETAALLRKAGHAAAEALADWLEPHKLAKLKPGERIRLVELALTRAFGPPVKREVSVTLSGDVSDAVSASLAALSARDLPEMRRTGDVLDGEPASSLSEGDDTREPRRPMSEPLRASERARRRTHSRYASDA